MNTPRANKAQLSSLAVSEVLSHVARHVSVCASHFTFDCDNTTAESLTCLRVWWDGSCQVVSQHLFVECMLQTMCVSKQPTKCQHKLPAETFVGGAYIYAQPDWLHCRHDHWIAGHTEASKKTQWQASACTCQGNLTQLASSTLDIRFRPVVNE